MINEKQVNQMNQVTRDQWEFAFLPLSIPEKVWHAFVSKFSWLVNLYPIKRTVDLQSLDFSAYFNQYYQSNW